MQWEPSLKLPSNATRKTINGPNDWGAAASPNLSRRNRWTRWTITSQHGTENVEIHDEWYWEFHQLQTFYCSETSHWAGEWWVSLKPLTSDCTFLQNTDFKCQFVTHGALQWHILAWGWYQTSYRFLNQSFWFELQFHCFGDDVIHQLIASQSSVWLILLDLWFQNWLLHLNLVFDFVNLL